MNFVNKWYIIILVIILFLSTPLTLQILQSGCTPAFTIDEKKLMESCNVTIGQYIERINANNSFCPEGDSAKIVFIDCGPSSDQVITFLISELVIIMIYNLLYTSIYLIFLRKK
jgi:hypothetical protein